MTSRLRLLAAIAAALLGGCVPLHRANPHYPATNSEVHAAAERMRSESAALDRPVVVLSGWHAPPIMAWNVCERLGDMTSQREEDFLAISYPLAIDLRRLPRHVVRQVDARWPSPDAEQTIEVDVVGVSMGGLVARLAAIEGATGPDGRRLRIRRLFTLATPHRGAKLSQLIAPDPSAWCMRPGSSLLGRLDGELDDLDYDLICYARLHDRWVGATRAAPPGRDPIWSSGSLVWSHFGVTQDTRLLADIARRLRGEMPLALGPSTPPHD